MQLYFIVWVGYINENIKCMNFFNPIKWSYQMWAQNVSIWWSVILGLEMASYVSSCKHTNNYYWDVKMPNGGYNNLWLRELQKDMIENNGTIGTENDRSKSGELIMLLWQAVTEEAIGVFFSATSRQWFYRLSANNQSPETRHFTINLTTQTAFTTRWGGLYDSTVIMPKLKCIDHTPPLPIAPSHNALLLTSSRIAKRNR